MSRYRGPRFKKIRRLGALPDFNLISVFLSLLLVFKTFFFILFSLQNAVFLGIPF